MDFSKIFKFSSSFSLIIGVLGTIWGLLFWLGPGELKLSLFEYFRIFIPISILGVILGTISILGVILGIMPIKLTSENEKLGIAGIILPLFSLLIWLSIWLLAIGFELEG